MLKYGFGDLVLGLGANGVSILPSKIGRIAIDLNFVKISI